MKYIYLLFSVFFLCFQPLAAFEADLYAAESALAQGRWVKVSVDHSDLYFISNQQLRQWGFTNPANVRVYGYGGRQQPQALTKKHMLDDLPMVQQIVTDKGITFYGAGPEQPANSASGAYELAPSIYTTKGYYFLSDTGAEPRPVDKQTQLPLRKTSKDTCLTVQHYELDRTSPGESGYLLVGESFLAQPSRRFTFSGLTAGDSATVECGLVSQSGADVRIEVQADGVKLKTNSTDRIPVMATASGYVHGSYTLSRHDTVPVKGTELSITLTVPSTASMRACWLDYIAINVKQPMRVYAQPRLYIGTEAMRMARPQGNEPNIWDVTDPNNITEINPHIAGDSIRWVNEYAGTRHYLVWDGAAALPSPEYCGTVANQNIHGKEGAEMIIFTLPQYAAQARRIQQLHAQAQEPISCLILDVNEVYNEFGSGAADVGALRKCLKMFYDRGLASESAAHLRYALLIGQPTYDNRHLTSQFDSNTAHGTIPCWMTGTRAAQLSDNTGYGTDDMIAILGDDDGNQPGLDDLCIGVGRIPVRSVEELKSTIDKLEQYVNQSKTGTWRNNMVVLADNGNDGVHVEQAERMIAHLQETPNSPMLVTKVYIDAYDIIGGVCVGGRDLMYRRLKEGAAWWMYAGHANNHTWTSEGMLTYTDMNSMYLTRLPVIMAATCDFLRWDSNVVSGGEIMFHERYGGCIAMISATRPVYISDNGQFTAAIGRAINKRDSSGRLPRLGDVYRMAKNNILSSSGAHQNSPNRLRFVLMGDPALQVVTPSNLVRVDSIAGQPLNSDQQITLKALQQTTISGSVLTPDGEVMPAFNGVVDVDIYDAEHSMNTKGIADEEKMIIFEQHGDKLFSGSALVKNGKFTLRVNMPGEVSDNFRPATMLMCAYAQATDSAASAMAAGLTNDFYVYGLDETVAPDTIPPMIESIVLNHSSFKNGDVVNTSPMVIATVSDNVAINLSTAGIGHQMSLTIDGKTTYSDVANYFTPSAQGDAGGSIAYPLNDLEPGTHTAKLKVWDTAGNSETATVDFGVAAGLAPTIYDVYSDANPAKTQANFYITHDRPDAHLTVTITVYTLMGAPVWQKSITGPSDMFTSAPVTWDLTDASGRRVQRGIYLYSATISEQQGEAYRTASRRLAVAAQ